MKAVLLLTTSAFLLLCLVYEARCQAAKAPAGSTPNPYQPKPPKNPVGPDGKFNKDLAANQLAGQFANHLTGRLLYVRDLVLDHLNAMSQTCGCMKDALAPFVPPYGNLPSNPTQGTNTGSGASKAVNQQQANRG